MAPADRNAVPKTDDLAPDRRRWIESTLGAPVSAARRLPTVRQAWAVKTDGGPGRALLRCARETEFGTGSLYTLGHECRVLGVLDRAGLPVPKVYGITDDGDAALLEWVDGRADFHRIADSDEADAVAHHFIDLLAQVHALDVESSGLELARPQTATEQSLAEVERWARLYEARVPGGDPLIDFALAWLRARAPRDATEVCLVQGDTGPGNFLFDGGRVTTIVDWELAHLGDPLEDLAWICARDLVTPFGHLHERFAHYERVSGRTVDSERLLYHRVSVMTRTALAVVVASQTLAAEAEVAEVLSWRVLYARAAIESLAAAADVGLERPAPIDADKAGESDTLLGLIATQLRGEQLPDIDDARRAHRMAGTLRLVDHLAHAGPRTNKVDAVEREELSTLLAVPVGDVAQGLSELGRRIREDSAPDDADVIRYLWRRACRSEDLFAPAMAGMAFAKLSPVG